MYQKFFYLKEMPFNVTPDPKFLYLGTKHREAIELLRYGINKRKGFIVLTGEVGTGKTTICRALLEKLADNVETALVLNPLLGPDEILKTVTNDLGLMPDTGGESRESSVKSHLDVLNTFLLDITAKGGNAVVIIDEAQNLSARALEMLRLISNLETETEKLIQIILVGQPELKEKLARRDLRQLNQRIIVRYDLAPLDRKETGAYIQSRLFIAGGSGSVEFAEGAVTAIFEATGGIPRMINILADRALTAAFVKSTREISAELVGEATDELTAEGYFGSAEVAPAESLGRFTPYVAALSFSGAFGAGFYWGPVLLAKTGLRLVLP